MRRSGHSALPWICRCCRMNWEVVRQALTTLEEAIFQNADLAVVSRIEAKLRCTSCLSEACRNRFDGHIGSCQNREVCRRLASVQGLALAWITILASDLEGMRQAAVGQVERAVQAGMEVLG